MAASFHAEALFVCPLGFLGIFLGILSHTDSPTPASASRSRASGCQAHGPARRRWGCPRLHPGSLLTGPRWARKACGPEWPHGHWGSYIRMSSIFRPGFRSSSGRQPAGTSRDHGALLRLVALATGEERSSGKSWSGRLPSGEAGCGKNALVERMTGGLHRQAELELGAFAGLAVPFDLAAERFSELAEDAAAPVDLASRTARPGPDPPSSA